MVLCANALRICIGAYFLPEIWQGALLKGERRRKICIKIGVKNRQIIQ